MTDQINRQINVAELQGAAQYDAEARKIAAANQAIADSAAKAGDAVAGSEVKIGASTRQISSVLRQTTADSEKFAKGHEALKAAFDRGVISTDELADRTQKLAGIYRGSINDAGEFVAAHEHIVGASKRAREGLVLLHEFIRGDFKRGLGSALIELQNFNALGILLNPVSLGLIALAGATATMVSANEAFEKSLLNVENALRRSGEASGVSVAGLRTMAEAAAKATNISVSSAMAAGAAFVNSGYLTQDGVGRALSILKDYAAFTGEDIPKAAASLAKAMEDPAKAAKTLAEQFRGSIAPAQLEMIQNFQASGDIARAQAILFDVLSAKTKGMADNIGTLDKIWDRVSTNVSNWWHNLGAGLAQGDPTDEIRKLESQIKSLQSLTADDVGGDASALGFREIEIERIRKKIADLRAEIERTNAEAAKGKAQADTNAIGAEALDLSKKYDPTAVKAQEFRNQIELLSKAVAAGGPDLARNAETLDKVKRAYETLIDPTQRLREENKIEAQVLAAPIAQRAELRARLQAELAVRGETITGTDAATRASLAETKVLIQRLAAGRDAVDQLQFEIGQTRALEAAVGKGADAMIRAVATNKVDADIRAGKIPVMTREAAIEGEIRKAIEDRALAQAKAVDQIKFDIAQTNALADAWTKGRAAVEYQTAANKVDAQIRAGSIELKNRELAIERELAKIQADKRLASAEALSQEQLTLQADQERLQVAQIIDPAQRAAETEKIARLQEIRRLTQAYGDDVDLVNQHLAVWDADNAAKKQTTYFDAVDKKAEQVSNDVSQFLVDGFVNAGKGGKSAFDNLWDGALAGGKRMLANLVAEWAKSRFIMPIVQTVVGSSAGAFGLAGQAAAAVGGTGSAASSGGSLLGNLSSVGNWLSGSSGWSLFGPQTAAGIDSWGLRNLGLGSTDPLGFGGVIQGTGLSSILSAAGLGGLGGGLASLLGVSKNPYGGLAGAAVGGLGAALGLGSIAGPIGLAVGLLGSLFGPSQHHTAGSVNLQYGSPDANGVFTGLTAGNAMGNMDVSGLLSTIQQAMSATQQVIQSLGGKINAVGSTTDRSGAVSYGYVGYDENTKNWNVTVGANTINDVPEAQIGTVLLRETLRFLVSNNGVTGLTNTEKAIVGSSAFGATTDQNQLQSYLAFGDTYDQIVKLADGTATYGEAADQTQAAIESLNKYFADATNTATQLGLATDKFATAAKNAQTALVQGFATGLTDQLNNATGRGFLSTFTGLVTQGKANFQSIADFQNAGVDLSGFGGAAGLRASALGTFDAQTIQALASLQPGQIDLVIAEFAGATDTFGMEIERLAKGVRDGTISIADSTAQMARAQQIATSVQGQINSAASKVSTYLIGARSDQYSGLSASDTLWSKWGDFWAARQIAIDDNHTGLSSKYSTLHEGEALANITTYADAARKAVFDYYGNTPQAIEMSKGILDSLGGIAKRQVDPTQLIIDALNGGDDSVVGAVRSLLNAPQGLGVIATNTGATATGVSTLSSRYDAATGTTTSTGQATLTDVVTALGGQGTNLHSDVTSTRAAVMAVLGAVSGGGQLHQDLAVTLPYWLNLLHIDANRQIGMLGGSEAGVATFILATNGWLSAVNDNVGRVRDETRAGWIAINQTLNAIKSDSLDAGVRVDLGGVRTDVQGARTDLGGVRTDVQGARTDLGGVRTDVQGVRTDLGGVRTDVQGVRTDLGGVRTDVQGVRTDVQVLPGHFLRLHDDLAITLHSDLAVTLHQDLNRVINILAGGEAGAGQWLLSIWGALGFVGSSYSTGGWTSTGSPSLAARLGSSVAQATNRSVLYYGSMSGDQIANYGSSFQIDLTNWWNQSDGPRAWLDSIRAGIWDVRDAMNGLRSDLASAKAASLAA